MYAPDSRPAPARPALARPNLARHQRGQSILELMVGAVVAMLVGLAATGSAVTFTAQQRQGIGVAGSVVNAATALSAVKNDAAAAGLGFFGEGRLMCHKLNLAVDGTPVLDGANFVPVRITAESAGDRIDVISATQVLAGSHVLLAAASNGESVELRSLLPAQAGQAVLLSPATPGDPCLVRTVSTVTAAGTNTRQTLAFTGTAPNNRYNGGNFTTAPVFPELGGVTLLGDLQWARYRLQGTDLLLERPLLGTSAVLARNVVAFRAEYGLADAGSPSLQNWQRATGSYTNLDAAGLPRVRALRIGLVTRSRQPEKPGADGVCTASAALPVLFGNTVTSDVSDWACYRFRTATVVVPMRNLVLGTAL